MTKTSTHKQALLKKLFKNAFILELLDLIKDTNKVKKIKCKVKTDACTKRVCRQRQSWKTFQTRLTDKQFRRYFRMDRQCFSDLCLQIETIIGESEFNSEDYLNGLSSPTISNIGKPKMMYAHMQSTGGFI